MMSTPSDIGRVADPGAPGLRASGVSSQNCAGVAQVAPTALSGGRPWLSEHDQQLAIIIDEAKAEGRTMRAAFGRAARVLKRTTEACHSRWRDISERGVGALETRKCLNCRQPFPKERGMFLCRTCKRNQR